MPLACPPLHLCLPTTPPFFPSLHPPKPQILQGQRRVHSFNRHAAGGRANETGSRPASLLPYSIEHSTRSERPSKGGSSRSELRAFGIDAVTVPVPTPISEKGTVGPSQDHGLGSSPHPFRAPSARILSYCAVTRKGSAYGSSTSVSPGPCPGPDAAGTRPCLLNRVVSASRNRHVLLLPALTSRSRPSAAS